MSKIIALIGYSRAGKDEVGKTFIKSGYKQFAFGDKVKQEYAEKNNFQIKEMYNHRKEFHRTGIIAYGEAKRFNCPSYWVEEIRDDIDNSIIEQNDIILTDLRRVPEIDYIQELKKENEEVFLIYIERPQNNGGIFDEDAESSKAIMYAKFHNFIDITISNSGTPEELSDLVTAIINTEINKKWKN